MPSSELASVSISEGAVLEALGNFIAEYVADVAVIRRAQDNRTPMPKGGSIYLNVVSRKRLSTNIVRYPTGTINNVPGQIVSRSDQQSIQYGMQVDFYGTTSHDWSVIFDTLFRSEVAVAFFNPWQTGISPLYSDDASQVALINGEDQFEERWTLTAYLQVIPVVTVPQQSFNKVDLGLIEVDTRYLHSNPE